jgi:hypothetical protein
VNGVTSMFDHLATMTDRNGLFEHADHARPRVEHGYCTDDNARLLIVAAREPDVGAVSRLGRVALAFTSAAVQPDGRVRNRMDAGGRWTDEPTTDDCWGRALWGLGVAATRHQDPVVARAADDAFHRAVRQRSRWPRAMAFAAIGTADVVLADPTDQPARRLLRDAASAIGVPAASPWIWPEGRLRYANAALAEALIAIGAALGNEVVCLRGLAMLAWLVGHESRDGRLSVTAVGGSTPGGGGPRFDQQPIEVAAIADACWRAYELTGDHRWVHGLDMAGRWFDGDNDSGMVMFDSVTSGGFDGLMVDSVNLNQGAESTLAFVSTRQRSRALARALAPVAS